MPLHFEIVVRKMESFKRENIIEIFEFDEVRKCLNCISLILRTYGLRNK